jgi:3-phenylpropionate/trans-cinnamate dioxygenase ferredoxin subunit
MAIVYYTVCSIDELTSGERMWIDLDGEPVVVFNIADEIFAIADVCTHDDGPLGEGEIENHQIVCPRHGARFDVRTGKVLSLPAVKGVKTYPIKVENNVIQIGIEEKSS